MINRLLGLPENIAEHGGRIDLFLETCHWFMLALLVGWSIYFFYVLCRFSKARNPRADWIGSRSKFSTYLEVGVIAFETVLLLGFAFPLWAQRVNQLPDEKNATVVHVIAQQFAWNFHYPGEDGKFGKRIPRLISEDNAIGLDAEDPDAKDDIVTMNQLHLPVNKPAIVQITSKDVIHSFCVRTLRITQDAIPGSLIPSWFTPVRTSKDVQEKMKQSFSIRHLPVGWLPAQDYNAADGTPILEKGKTISLEDAPKLKLAGITEIVAAPSNPTEIICAQLCGNSHYRMRGFLMVETEAEFNQWKASQQKFAQ